MKTLETNIFYSDQSSNQMIAIKKDHPKTSQDLRDLRFQQQVCEWGKPAKKSGDYVPVKQENKMMSQVILLIIMEMSYPALRKLNSSPLKIEIDGWKMKFLLGWWIFRGYVSMSVGVSQSHLLSNNHLFFLFTVSSAPGKKNVACRIDLY